MNKQIFKRIFDNMVFAMNLSDDIPEHIMTEIMQSRVGQGTESVFAKPELLEDFNVDVDRKLKPQLGPQSQSQSRPHHHHHYNNYNNYNNSIIHSQKKSFSTKYMGTMI
jgi:hypothetical protein